jgi:hypothetical protein
LRRGDSPSGQNDLRRFDAKALATAFDFHAGNLLAGKQEAPHQYIRFDGQVEAMADRIKIGQGRAHTDTIGVIHWDRPHPHGIGVVHIRIGGEIRRQTRLIECLLRRQPGLGLMATNRNGPIAAVEVIPHVRVRFRFTKVGQDLAEGPCVVAHGRPVVVVFGDTAQKHLPINGTGAPDDSAARHGHRSALLGGRDAHEGPVVGRVDC